MKILIFLFYVLIFFQSLYSMERDAKRLNNNIRLNRDHRLRSFENDCLNFQQENELIPINQANNIRIVTYNVHYWTDSFGRPNFDGILAVIRDINADILVLQEVDWGVSQFNNRTTSEIKERFKELGYMNFFFGQAAHFRGAPFGNVIISKYPFVRVPRSIILDAFPANNERRCLLNAVIRLPDNNEVSIYGTHLDVHDITGIVRRNQIQQCIDIINRDQTTNILFAGDFNEIRRQDYSPEMWNSILVDNLTRGDLTPTNVHQLIATTSQLQDCFRSIHFPHPHFTVWNGTIIDFIYLKNGTWYLPVNGCYAYYDAASDHIPIILDVEVNVAV